jgi:DNA-binding IscR family transcriptional regulator
MSTKFLFPAHVLHAMNAIQYLRAMHIIGEPYDSSIYSTAHQIADDIKAPRDSIARIMPVLARLGLVKTRAGACGGYKIVPTALVILRVVDIINALGTNIPDTDNVRGSDRLNVKVSECLSVSLEKFLD